MRNAVHAFTVLATLIAPSAHAACNIVDGKAYGDCSNVTINRGTSPRITVDGYRSAAGVIAGARVVSGGSFYLSGIAEGPIIVERGGRVSISGIAGVVRLAGMGSVSGKARHVILEGGHLDVDGQIGSVSGRGTARFAPGSILGGRPLLEGKTMTLQ